MLSENIIRHYDMWSYLQQWMEDCYWDELSELDWAIEDYYMEGLT